jgi:hypothetical protein
VEPDDIYFQIWEKIAKLLLPGMMPSNRRAFPVALVPSLVDARGVPFFGNTPILKWSRAHNNNWCDPTFTNALVGENLFWVFI